MVVAHVEARVAPRSLFRELLAVLLLTIGSIVPVVPWLVGVALLWTSDRWRVGEKLLATLVWPFGYSAALVATAFGPTGTESCESSASLPDDPTPGRWHCTTTGMSETTGIVLMAVLVIVPLVVDGVLLVRAARRARAERASYDSA